MKITERLYLVGSGRSGFGMTNPSDSHVYLVESTSGNIMIDAGVGLEVDRIIGVIEGDGIDPPTVDHLFLTHVHSDHAGGTAEFKRRFDCTVYVPRLEAEILRTGDEDLLSLPVAKADGIYPEDYTFTPCNPDVELAGGETFTFGEVTVQAIHTPGHSSGSTCYLVETEGKRCLFSGDVVLHNGLLLFLNCLGSTMEGYRASLPKLAGLDVDMLMPGHGLFTFSNGQEHIDKAVEAIKHLAPPPAMW